MFIYTIQLSKAKQLGIENILDITVKSGNKLFAPAWGMVNDVKSGIITPEQYTKMYYTMMRLSYKNNITEWDTILNKGNNIPIILGCYCKPYTFCHRYLLKDILIKCYEKSYYMGEIGISNDGIIKQIQIDFQRYESKLKERDDKSKG